MRSAIFCGAILIATCINPAYCPSETTIEFSAGLLIMFIVMDIVDFLRNKK